VCGTAHATIVNGNFSSGLVSWSSFGDASTQSGAAFLTTASLDFGDDFPAVPGAFNYSGFTAGLAATGSGLEQATGLATGALDVGGFALEGSAIAQTFNVNAGDILSFSYNFFTNEGSFPDFAYYSVNGSLFSLAGVADATTSSSPFSWEKGLLSGSHVFTTTGSVTLGFGVVDIDDYNATSALSIDNVTISSVPDSSATAALMSLGLLGLVALSRRQAV